MKYTRTFVITLFISIFLIIFVHPVSALVLPTNRSLHMVIVFTKFKYELPETTTAPWWAVRLFNGSGSIPFYWDEVSFGKIQVNGEYLNKVYELPESGSSYIGKSDEYAKKVVEMVDGDIDFGLYDNDGPDGIPNSGDDDGTVDYIVLVPLNIQTGLIRDNATGLATIPVGQYLTNDKAPGTDESIYVRSSYGCIASATNLDMAIGSICHEFGHALGAADLYDTAYETPVLDSAGIGWWGLMGRGVSGWNNTGGPVAPCAYTRTQIGCTNLVDIFGSLSNLRITDTSQSNSLTYRIWAGYNEYFLISYRRNDRLYCDRNLPGCGLLIWHVYEYGSNTEETLKLCDLECADGLYVDAGYPLGTTADPDNGSDNLDFWAHGDSYEEEHAGNLGDATDMFDGITYTRFGPDTNPSSYSHKRASYTGILIDNIRWDGDDMLFDYSGSVGTTIQPTSYPLSGLGWQSESLGINNGSNGNSMIFYLVRYNDTSKATLISVCGDSTNVSDITGENSEEIISIVDSYMITVASNMKNSMITHETIKPDEITLFSELIDKSVQSVEKMTLYSINSTIPTEITLNQNYPNPFNSSTSISFMIPLIGTYRFEVYNILGQRIHINDLGQMAPGEHHVSFSPDGLSSGVYIYRITGNEVSSSRKMTYVR